MPQAELPPVLFQRLDVFPPLICPVWRWAGPVSDEKLLGHAFVAFGVVLVASVGLALAVPAR